MVSLIFGYNIIASNQTTTALFEVRNRCERSTLQSSHYRLRKYDRYGMERSFYAGGGLNIVILGSLFGRGKTFWVCCTHEPKVIDVLVRAVEVLILVNAGPRNDQEQRLDCIPPLLTHFTCYPLSHHEVLHLLLTSNSLMSTLPLVVV